MKLGSLFSGSGGFELAGMLNGIEPVWCSEIEPFCVRVEALRFPNCKQLGSVTDIDGGAIEPVDVITFGSPCQDLSVAGKQAGIHDGERSSLFFEAIRIIKEMRNATANVFPRFAVWENVPGAFSSNKGEDFRAVLEAFQEISDRDGYHVPQPPKGKWNHSGTIVGDGWSLAWRMYDAQFWGVPQRRKRIYLIADFAGERAGEILLECESLCGNSQESGTPGKGTSGDTERSAGRGDLHVYCLQGNVVDRDAKMNGCGWRESISHTLNATDRHAVVCLNDQGGAVMDVSDKAMTLRAQEHGHQPVVCFPLENHPADSRITLHEPDSPVQTLTSRMGTGGGNVPMVLVETPTHVYNQMTFGEFKESKVASTILASDAQRTDPKNIAVCIGNCQTNQISMQPIANCLDTMHDKQAILTEGKPPRKYIVRRLTPTECLRLQGLPDWWCDGANGSDTAIYKMAGNGLAIPCAYDVLRRIAKAGSGGEKPDEKPLAGSVGEGTETLPMWRERPIQIPDAMPLDRVQEVRTPDRLLHGLDGTERSDSEERSSKSLERPEGPALVKEIRRKTMTEKEYNEHPGVRRTELWRIHESPEKYKWFKDHPEDPTPAMLFGTVVHKLLLDRDTFDNEFAVLPDVDKRTKAGKEVMEAFMAENAGKTLISSDMLTQAMDMLERVYTDPYTNRLMSSDGMNEHSVFWKDPDTGLDCKVRFDRVCYLPDRDEEHPLIIDYKTASDGRTDVFNHVMFKLGYHLQAFMYTEGAMKSFGLKERPDFLFVVQEKKPPYSLNYVLVPGDSAVMRAGEDIFRESLGTLKQCMEMDHWYGYAGPYGEPNEAYLPGYLTMGDEEV